MLSPILQKKQLSTRFVFYGVVLLALGIACIFTHFQSFIFYPNNPPYSLPASYSDKEQGGTSFSDIKNVNGLLHLQFKLGKGYAYPYAGCSFALPDTLEPYNTLCLSLKVSEETAVSILFSEHKSNGQTLQLLQHTEYVLHCTPGQTSYSIPLSAFQVPVWWQKSLGKQQTPAIEWSHINTLSFQNNPLLPVGFTQKFVVSAISFQNYHSWPLYTLGCLMLIILVAEYKIYGKKVEKTIRYVPVADSEWTTNDPWEKISHYLARHYREEISLENVYLATGIGKHKVSSLIKEKTALNFRQYINEIRICEAERLFRETSLKVTEIGYEVGFSSATPLQPCVQGN